MFNLVNLTDQRILVTGASSGIGRACAALLSRLGASVVLSGRRIDALEATRQEMECSERHAVVPCDLSEAGAAFRLVKEVGPVSGLVHAAGVCPICGIGVLDAVERDRLMAVNYLAFLDMMQHYAKTRNRLAPFSAVAVSSVSAEAGWSGGVAYCGTKGALSASVRALAIELASKGVRVNAVCPGSVKTPLQAEQAAALGQAFADDPRRPLGLGRPEDVASAVAFLLSPAAQFITGVNLPVDGGYLAQ